MHRSVVGAGMRPYRRADPSGDSAKPSRSWLRFRCLREWWFWVLAGVGLVLAGVLAAYLARESIAAAAARAWVVDEIPQQADAIVMLAGGVESRPHTAAALWERRYAPTILVTMLMAAPGRMLSEGDYATNTIRSHGVPEEAMHLLEMQVGSTYDEAVSVLQWARETGATRILMVTDPFHTRRARWIFKRVLDPWGIEVVCVAAPPVGFELDRWWDNEFSLVEFPNEIIKYVMYRRKY